MARKREVPVDYSGMDPEMASTIRGEARRRIGIKKATEPFAESTYGGPRKESAPKEVSTDKHWAEVEAEIQHKRTMSRSLRILNRK